MMFQEKIKIVNLYNLCKKLRMDILKKATGEMSNRVIICGDFSSHNHLWGNKSTDYNGEVIEDFM